MKKTTITFLSLIIILNFSSCYFDCETGEGEVTTITKDLVDFDMIELRGSGKVIIKKSNKFSFSVETNKNLIPLLEQKIEDGTLVLKTNKCISNYTKMNYYISMPELVGLKISGSGKIICEDTFESENFEFAISGSGDIEGKFKAENISSTISGSGDISLYGRTDDQSVRISGSGDFHGFRLKSNNSDVKIMGSGDAELYAKEKLNASVTGSGDIIYKGSPDVNSSVTGSGSVVEE